MLGYRTNLMECKNLFITGKPACGKTTLIKEAVLPYMPKIGGFYTEEIKDNNERQGFLLKSFDGASGVLAKKGMKSPHKLNKYGIDAGVLENIGIRSIKNAIAQRKIIVIDEIGSMEVISENFRKVIMEALGSSLNVLATIRYHSQPFTDEVKKMENTSMLYLSRENHIDVKNQVKAWIGGIVNG
jgi:nucleoside-triphosphatase